jgi:hypothetical protein
MKYIYTYICALFVIAVFTGCYKHIPKETAITADVKDIAFGTSAPSKEEADIIIMAHVKKKMTENRNTYSFTLIVDGKEFKESIKGVNEKESDITEERGEGIRYSLVKRIRVKPGIHEITLLTPEEKHSSKIIRELAGGKTYTVRFEPIYGPMRLGRPKHFRSGVMNFDIFFEIGNHLIE